MDMFGQMEIFTWSTVPGDPDAARPVGRQVHLGASVTVLGSTAGVR
jgi:hypothetical protein